VTRFYETKRKELAGLGLSKSDLQDAAEKLAAERLALLDSLLRPAPEAGGSDAFATTASQAPAGAAGSADDSQPVSTPLAFFDPDPSIPLSDDQRDSLDALRKQFMDSLGSAARNPTDPEYARRWREAQPQLDQQFHAIFGDEVYNSLHVKAMREADAPQP
jgi:hypothetical protein